MKANIQYNIMRPNALIKSTIKPLCIGNCDFFPLRLILLRPTHNNTPYLTPYYKKYSYTIMLSLWQFLKYFFKKFVLVFAKETTIHGVPLIVTPKIHVVERLFWLSIIILSLAGAVSLTISNLNRYNASPTVVSIQKDFRNWKNTLPSATGCFLKKADSELAEKYIQETWGISESHPNYDYYLKFVNAVANVSYQTLESFAEFQNDTAFNKVNYLELAAKVHPKVTGTLVTFDPKSNSYWKLVMTEMGICFMVNNKFSNVLTFKVKGINVTKPNVDESILKCHYLNGLCYARYDADPLTTLYFYVHSYLDVIHATTNAPYYLRESEEFEINYMVRETNAASSIRPLKPSQRNCHFDDEPLTKDVSIYSTSICYINCRYRLAIRLCGCKPFFYHFMGGRLCNITGMVCLAKHAQYITLPPSQIGCKCPQPCEIITYLPLTPKITIWKSGYFDQRITFRWGIMHPNTKYRRDIIFGFEDLVVSIGGTLALFLGVSFMSLIEIVFFIFEFVGSLICNKTNIQEELESNNDKTIHVGKKKDLVNAPFRDLQNDSLPQENVKFRIRPFGGSNTRLRM